MFAPCKIINSGNEFKIQSVAVPVTGNARKYTSYLYRPKQCEIK